MNWRDNCHRFHRSINSSAKPQEKDRTIQLSLQVADGITSIDQLEQYVEDLGHQIKRQLFTNLLTQFYQSKSQLDSSQSTCPSCQKTETIAWGERPRVLQTVFGQVRFRLPHQKCRPCQHTFSLSRPGLENRSTGLSAKRPMCFGN